MSGLTRDITMGYTQEDFERLLGTLSGIQGKFLLSSYRNKALNEFVAKYGWQTMELKMALSMTHRNKTKRQKIEVITANYPIADKVKVE
jgi:DNA adenine methylase